MVVNCSFDMKWFNSERSHLLTKKGSKKYSPTRAPSPHLQVKWTVSYLLGNIMHLMMEIALAINAMIEAVVITPIKAYLRESENIKCKHTCI